MRYPRGTPYQGPTANYDRLTSPAQNLARVVYGLPRPLLMPRQRMDAAFYGRLLDELANSHAVLVKVCSTYGFGRKFATQLRKELPGDLYEVGVKQNEDDPRPDEWLIIVYNRVTQRLLRPSWMNPMTPEGDQWVDVKEAAHVLGLRLQQTRDLIHQYDIPRRYVGGRRKIEIRRSALLRLANRPGRWKKRSSR